MAAWLPVILAAQDSPFSALIDKYSGNPGFESSVILPNNTSFEWEKEVDNSSVKDMMKGIEEISVLKYKADGNRDVSEKLWKNIQKAASDEAYIELMNVSSEDVQVNICMIKGDEGTTREVALAVNDKDEIILITMNGTMDFSSMFSKENLEGLSEMGEYFMEHKGGCESR
jgi:hypothetical protein